MNKKMMANELVKIAKELKAVKYRGYTIEKSGSNYYVKDPKGHRAFGEVPVNVETAKKWIDMEVAGKGKTAKELSPESAPSGVKDYYAQFSVGKAKYVVNYHNGVSAHRDGSKFYDIAIFSNKRTFETFMDDLNKQGYNEK